MPERYEVKAAFGLGEIAVEDPKLLHRVVDLLAIPAEAAAKLTASTIHVLHLPIVALEKYGERLVGLIDAAQAQVPPERQIPPAPSVAGPILENVKYLEDGNPLLRMYENLLARALDRDRENEAHPAFPALIQQLSADEALLLYHLAKGELRRIESYKSYPALGYNPKPGEPPTVDSRSTWLVEGLRHLQHERLYCSRLMGLGLTGIRPESHQTLTTNDTEETHHVVTVTTDVFLSDFGKLFAKACIPDTWPSTVRPEGSAPR